MENDHKEGGHKCPVSVPGSALTASAKALCTCSSSGRGSLSSKLEVISKTACDPSPIYSPVGYMNCPRAPVNTVPVHASTNVEYVTHDAYMKTAYYTPQLQSPVEGGSYGHHYQPGIPPGSPYMYPSSPHMVVCQSPRSAFMRVCPMVCDPCYVREYDPMMSIGVPEDSSVDGNSFVSSQNSEQSELMRESPSCSFPAPLCDRSDLEPAAKKIRLRNINDPEKTIMVQPTSSTGASGAMYHIQATQSEQSAPQAAGPSNYKEVVTYVQEEDKIYADISKSHVSSDSSQQPNTKEQTNEIQEQTNEILEQWLSFFKSIVPPGLPLFLHDL